MNWWRYPTAIIIGFCVQWFYLPSHSNSPFDGITLILCLCAGTCIAYYLGWR